MCCRFTTVHSGEKIFKTVINHAQEGCEDDGADGPSPQGISFNHLICKTHLSQVTQVLLKLEHNQNVTMSRRRHG